MTSDRSRTRTPDSWPYRILVLALLTPLATACSGGVENSPGPGQSTSDRAATTTSPPRPPESNDLEVPADFVIPIVEGGTIESNYLGGPGAYGEITISYPESEYQALVTFYTSYVQDQGGAGGELYPAGFEWNIQDNGLTVIRVTPTPPPWISTPAVAVVFIQRTR